MTTRPAFPTLARGALALCLAFGLLGEAHAFDTYNPGTGQLSIPTLLVGGTMTLSDVVVQVGSILTPPSGNYAYGSVDTYDPASQQLTVQTVAVGSNLYYNVVISVRGLVSAGSVSGADTYANGQVSIPQVQVGGSIYTDVVITVGSIISAGGGMPGNTIDVYDAANRQLTIAAGQVGNTVYTNPIITPGNILAVASRLPVETQLYLFAGNENNSTDGVTPQAGLLVAGNGSLYGTTASGGLYGYGTVFSLTSAGAESVLYSFGGPSTDAAEPSGGLIQDSSGNLYGVASVGGANGSGAVFEITAAGVESVLYSFGASATDGTGPLGSLVFDGAGNLYGVTSIGGANDGGTVFELSPSGAETVLYSFTGAADGASPLGLTAGTDGSFYGTTSSGGAYGVGTVFKITPSGSSGATPSATFTLLYGFGTNNNDAQVPNAPLVLGQDGNFYGTGYFGGQDGDGAVFEITSAGAESLVYSFTGSVAGSLDGAYPGAALVLGTDGNLYGTTEYGGTYSVGTVFRITPGAAGASGNELTLYSFNGQDDAGHGISGSTDGLFPAGPLVEAADGTFYGLTPAGGIDQAGMVYKLTDVLAAF